MMTRIFWDTFFLISGSLFTLGAGPSNSTVVKPPKGSTSTSAAAGDTSPPTIVSTADHGPPVQTFLFTSGAEPSRTVATESSISAETAFTADRSASTSSPAATVASVAAPAESFLSTSGAHLGNTTAAGADNSADTSYAGDLTTSTTSAATTASVKTKKFVAAAVRSHFNECPDSHRHFCFHGTCRFLILEESPACVCHPGFVGMRCEHADLLAVVATNHKQTVTTVLVLCVIGCVLVMLLCMLLHCWWRQECRRRRQAHYYCPQKHAWSEVTCWCVFLVMSQLQMLRMVSKLTGSERSRTVSMAGTGLMMNLKYSHIFLFGVGVLTCGVTRFLLNEPL